MQFAQKIAPCLWFDDQAEQAASLYVSTFDNSRIVSKSYYSEAGQEIHGRPAGSVMTVAFELDGQAMTALNGGPIFQFNEAVSFQVFCDDQQEVDHFWNSLSDGGDPNARQCGWLKDRFGVSWQIVPRVLLERINDPDPVKSQRVTQAMLQMKKLDIAEIERAYAG